MGLLSFLRKDDADGNAFEASGADDGGATRSKRKRQKDNQPVDPVLPEKQRARRRLIGAVALVLAAVIGLPMVLDPEPKPLADDISIDIPSRDKAKQGARAPAAVPAAAALDQREEIVSPPTTSSVGKPVTPAVGNGAAEPKASPDPATLAARADAAPAVKSDVKATPEKSPVAPEAKKPDVTATEAAARAAQKPERPAEGKSAADDARARAILDGKAAPAQPAATDKLKTVADKPERYLVQVAALASPEKVQELQGKLKAAGIKSHTQKVATQSGERIRVRVGPVEGKAEAEKVRAKLGKLGLNGTLVPA